MKRILPIILSLVVVLAVLPAVSAEPADVDYDALVGESNADSGFELEFKAPEKYKPGDEITVSVAVNNITIPEGLTVVRFDLYYDNTKLLITNDINERDNGNGCALDFKPLEGTQWEECVTIESNFMDLTEEDFNSGLQASPTNNGIVKVSALTPVVEGESITEDDKLVFNFTFIVDEDAQGDIALYIPNDSVDGGYNTEFGANVFNGNGGYVLIAYDDTPDGVLGDVDADGDVDAADYVLVKRAVLKTYELTEEQQVVADIDADADVDATDYVLVKRIVLGTYKVK